MPIIDIAALVLFMFAWLFYEPLLKRLGEGGNLINTDMTVIRRRWMQEMAVREIALLDGQLLGHAINSASFFASSNLILIAAAAGVLFGGDTALKSIGLESGFYLYLAGMMAMGAMIALALRDSGQHSRILED